MATTKGSKPKAALLKLEQGEPSLLFAIKELIQNGGVDFKEWWEGWEEGFNTRDDKKSNFKIKEWRKTGERPMYTDITPKEKNGGVKTIEYLPNKKNPKISFVCSGTDTQIINQIVQIEHFQITTGLNSLSGKNSKPPLEGFPLITLTFYQPYNEVNKRADGTKKSPTRGIKYIRMPGFTDDQAVADFGLAELVKPTDVTKWAKGILTTFALPELYKWEKGKNVISYMSMIARLQGLEGWAYCRRESEGVRLFTAMLAAVGKKPDSLAFNYSGSTQAAKKFAPGQPTKKLLGQEWDADEKRPNATVVFNRADLWLPKIKTSIPLVQGNALMYQN
ncbi:hypothetical protein QUB47_19025 [Microcoleus sp. AT9_B5]